MLLKNDETIMKNIRQLKSEYGKKVIMKLIPPETKFEQVRIKRC